MPKSVEPHRGLCRVRRPLAPSSSLGPVHSKPPPVVDEGWMHQPSAEQEQILRHPAANRASLSHGGLEHAGDIVESPWISQSSNLKCRCSGFARGFSSCFNIGWRRNQQPSCRIRSCAELAATLHQACALIDEEGEASCAPSIPTLSNWNSGRELKNAPSGRWCVALRGSRCKRYFEKDGMFSSNISPTHFTLHKISPFTLLIATSILAAFTYWSLALRT